MIKKIANENFDSLDFFFFFDKFWKFVYYHNFDLLAKFDERLTLPEPCFFFFCLFQWRTVGECGLVEVHQVRVFELLQYYWTVMV